MKQSSFCRFCGKALADNKSRNRHERAQHTNKLYHCNRCGKGFKYTSNRTTHSKSCKPLRSPLNEDVPKMFHNTIAFYEDSDEDDYIDIWNMPEWEVQRGDNNVTSEITMPAEDSSTSQDDDADITDQLGGADSGADVDEREPWMLEDGSVDEALRDIYIQHSNSIYREHQLKSQILHEYNFHLPNGNVDMDDIIKQLEYIYLHEDTAFRVNLSLGFILANRDTGELRYWYAHNNESVFNNNESSEAVPMIASRADVDKLIERLRLINFHVNAWQHRENTKSLLYRITNTRWAVIKVDAPLGAPTVLPDYLKKKNSIVGLTYDYANNQPYNDNLCLFRCLAFHRAYTSSTCETRRDTQKILRHLNIDPLIQKWKDHMDKSRVVSIQIVDLPLFEALFEININIYDLDCEQHASLFYKSLGKFDETMYLNHFDRHLSYITKFGSYAGAFQCRNCGMFMKCTSNLHRHERVCDRASNLRYPGGFYRSPISLHKELISLGVINSDEARKFYKFVCAFDMESILKKINVKSDTGKMVWTAEHQAISVSLCSNVPEFESPKCFVDPDLDSLLKKMFCYLKDIQQKASSEMMDEFSDIIHRLQSEIEELQSQVPKKSCNRTNIQDCDGDDEDYDDTDLNDNDDEARETDEYEPVSEEMLRALAKPNTAMKFFENIARIGEDATSSAVDDLTLYGTESERSHDDSEHEDENDSDNNDGNDDEENMFSTFDDMTHSQYSCCTDPSSPHNVRDTPNCTDYDMEDQQDSDSVSETEAEHPLVLKQKLKMYENVLKRVKEHISQLPVIGFNSQKYDLNLVKSKLLKHIIKNESNPSAIYIAKKGNAYANISTTHFKFLDALNFSSPGVSYDRFLKAYGSKVTKSYMPYEWFDDVAKLAYPHLPPYEAFFSSLKGHNTLESDYLAYQKLLTEGLSQELALKTMHAKTVPKTGQENYKDLQNIWHENGMATFEDFLRFYNNRDVEPFVNALMEMVTFYREKDIDLFRETQSVPGVARLLLMRSISQDCHFSLFKPRHKDFYKKIKNNIVGGPSIIFHRYHNADETYIRGGDEITKTVMGWDANALYLWAISQPMPTGPYTIRKSEDGFLKDKQETYLKEWYWLEWIAHIQNIKIQHKFNGGQFRVGPFLLDGVCGKKAFEFNGCFFHGHECWMTKNLSLEQQEGANQRRKHTQQRKQFLEREGYQVTEIFECEYHEQLRNSPEMREFMIRFERPCDKFKTMSRDDILEAVMNETLFGAIEVDISVPNHLYEKFKEMSPIFCTGDVDFNSFGPEMQDFVKANNLSQKPRKLLIGGMKAERILLASPLLRWYIQHGLQVTAVHCVIEYDPKSCFDQFVKDITAARILGDLDPAHACKGDTCKLIGNSAYGSVIMDKLKHMFTCIVQGLAKAQKKVNHRLFRKLEELDEDVYELQMAKRRISLNMPHQVGFFILQYAKLRMLQFYYDFLDRYVPRKMFELIEMDTDSLYFALAKTSLEEAVRPELLQEFHEIKHKWLPRTDTEEHKRLDRRQPGLFKLEAKGTQMTALCSKTYCLYDETTDTAKFSCKGLNKSQFKKPMDIYKHVLQTGQSESGVNIGFRLRNQRMHTYHQERLGFSNFYCKRLVNPDGVSTSPLDLTLKPPQ